MDQLRQEKRHRGCEMRVRLCEHDSAASQSGGRCQEVPSSSTVLRCPSKTKGCVMIKVQNLFKYWLHQKASEGFQRQLDRFYDITVCTQNQRSIIISVLLVIHMLVNTAEATFAI